MEVIKSMQSKIAVLFFLAFMGLEDFKDQCVSLWKILLFLITGIFYFCIQYQWISIPFFPKCRLLLLPVFPPFPQFFFPFCPELHCYYYAGFQTVQSSGRRIDCACPWHLDWVLGITRSLIRCFFSFFFRGRIFILLS